MRRGKSEIRKERLHLVGMLIEILDELCRETVGTVKVIRQLRECVVFGVERVLLGKARARFG